MEELQEVFTYYDKTGSNKIDPSDMETFLFACGLNPIKADIAKMLEEIGKNPLTFETACSYYKSMSSKSETVCNKNFIEIFKPFDREANGTITVPEFRKITSQLGDKLTEDELELLLNNVEVTSNGSIVYEDLVKWALEK